MIKYCTKADMTCNNGFLTKTLYVESFGAIRLKVILYYKKLDVYPLFGSSAKTGTVKEEDQNNGIAPIQHHMPKPRPKQPGAHLFSAQSLYATSSDSLEHPRQPLSISATQQILSLSPFFSRGIFSNNFTIRYNYYHKFCELFIYCVIRNNKVQEFFF